MTFGFLDNQPQQTFQGDPLTFGPASELTLDLTLDFEADVHQMTFETEVVGGSPGDPGGAVGDGWETCAAASCTDSMDPHGATFDLDVAPAPGNALAGASGAADCLDGAFTLTSDLTCYATFELLVQIFSDGFEDSSTSAWSRVLQWPDDPKHPSEASSGGLARWPLFALGHEQLKTRAGTAAHAHRRGVPPMASSTATPGPAVALLALTSACRRFYGTF